MYYKQKFWRQKLGAEKKKESAKDSSTWKY